MTAQEELFGALLEDFGFLPASRIQAGAGLKGDLEVNLVIGLSG